MSKSESKPAASPDELLKAAVAGKEAPVAERSEARPEGSAKDSAGTSSKGPAVPAWMRREARLLAAAGAALALGLAVGAGAASLAAPPREATSASVLAALEAGFEAGRGETARLGGEVAHLQQAVAELRGLAEAGRKETVTRGAALGERLNQIDKGVAGKLAALGERLDQSEREQGARLAALAERRPAPKAEPAQTGSLPETKPEPRAADLKPADPKPTEGRVADARGPDPRFQEAKPRPAAPEKPPVIEGWALRDVFDGTAILENRHRRLVEVAPGDTLPGVGRVEAVERQGRAWVVVTRQGIVTAQPW